MLALAGLAMGFAGCEDSARSHAAYRPSSTGAPLQLRDRINVVCDRSDAPIATRSGAACDAALSLALNPRRILGAYSHKCGRIPDLAAVHPTASQFWRIKSRRFTRRGQQDLNANRVARALQRFTEAQALLIESDFDVQSDPRLAALYSRIMDGIIRTDQPPVPKDWTVRRRADRASPTCASGCNHLIDAAAGRGRGTGGSKLAHKCRGRIATGAARFADDGKRYRPLISEFFPDNTRPRHC